jgi:hypothetical protein
MIRTINYLAERAALPSDWTSAVKNTLVFLIVAMPVHVLADWTESTTPFFIFGWAWGSLGTYHMMRNRTGR